MSKKPARRNKGFENHSDILDIMTSQMDDMVYYKDKEFRYIFSSKPHCDRILKCSQEECIGLTDVEIAEQYRKTGREQGFGEICLDSDQQTKQAGKPGQYVEVANIDGEEIWLEVHKTPYYDETGAFAGIIGCSREITERRRMEQKLKESEKKFRELADLLPQPVFEFNTEGYFTYSNRSGFETFGYTPEDLEKGVHALELYVPEDRKRVQENIRKRLTGEQFEGHEYTGLRKDGSTFPILVYSAPIIRDNKPTGVRGIVLDITDRKRIEEELRKHRDRLEELVDARTSELKEAEQRNRLAKEEWERTFDAISDVVTIHDTSQRIMRMNKAALQLVGGSEEAWRGIFCYEVSRGAKAPCQGCPSLETIRDQKPHSVTIEHTYLGKTFLVSTSPIFDDGGAFTGVVHTAKDITEHKRLEAQLLQAHKMEAIGTLAGGIAHDFNNLLMGIQGNASLMQLDIDPDHPHFDRLKDIGQAVERGAGLTSQLLGFAQGGKYEVKPTDLNFTILKTSQMFGRTNKEIKIACRYQKDIWLVEVDREQIEQVLLNLYVNAGQAMPEGGELHLQTENVTSTEENVGPLQMAPGKYVKVTVTDTGVGMDEETQKRIFDPFFTTKEMGRGTGLGLASAYGIIKNHGGFIDVHSEKRKGTTFTICLPASEKEREESKEISEHAPVKKKERVLLVDDEDLIINVGAELLKALGYNTIVARSGKEALEIYEKEKDNVDLVILDMIIPNLGGGETYDRLKEMNPEIKVLLASGYSLNGRAKEILGRGCNGFIQKPFSMKQLSGKIREILEGKITGLGKR